MDAKEYHENLHKQINKAENFAAAIYHDVRLDIDHQANERTGYRLNVIDTQHGPTAVFGILGNWAMKTAEILYQSRVLNHPPRGPEDEEQAMSGFISEEMKTSEMDTEARARLSGVQFVTAISNDDLEMAEAIYLAARNSSVDDATALVTVILHTFINVSNQYLDG